MVGDNPFVLVEDEFKTISHNSLTMAEVGALETVPALFQTGYRLAISKFPQQLKGKSSRMLMMIEAQKVPFIGP
jgi:hypothetical protein